LSKKVYVGNLSFETTESDVRELMGEYGNIESVAWITDRDTGRFRGFCFVEIEEEAAAKAISALDGKEVDGRNLKVNEARPRVERGGGGGQNRGGGNRSGGNRYPDSGGGW
jgi:RNA recognition motif-containing protein